MTEQLSELHEQPKVPESREVSKEESLETTATELTEAIQSASDEAKSIEARAREVVDPGQQRGLLKDARSAYAKFLGGIAERFKQWPPQIKQELLKIEFFREGLYAMQEVRRETIGKVAGEELTRQASLLEMGAIKIVGRFDAIKALTMYKKGLEKRTDPKENAQWKFFATDLMPALDTRIYKAFHEGEYGKSGEKYGKNYKAAAKVYDEIPDGIFSKSQQAHFANRIIWRKFSSLQLKTMRVVQDEGVQSLKYGPDEEIMSELVQEVRGIEHIAVAAIAAGDEPGGLYPIPWKESSMRAVLQAALDKDIDPAMLAKIEMAHFNGKTPQELLPVFADAYRQHAPDRFVKYIRELRAEFDRLDPGEQSKVFDGALDRANVRDLLLVLPRELTDQQMAQIRDRVSSSVEQGIELLKHPELLNGLRISRAELTQQLIGRLPLDLIMREDFEELGFSEKERELLAYNAYVNALYGAKSEMLNLIASKTGDENRAGNPVFRRAAEMALAEAQPSNYQAIQKIVEKIWRGREDAPDTAWGPSFRALAKVQGRSANAEYDPWLTDLDPLVKYVKDNRILDVGSAKDGEVLVEYVRTFGMHNLHTLVRWYSGISRVDSLTELEPKLGDEISQALGIELKGDRRLIVEKLRDYKFKLQSELLADTVPVEMQTNPVALELFKAMRGNSRFSSAGDVPEIVSLWQKTVATKPKLAKLPPGYKEGSFEVPALERRTDRDTETKTRELLSNKELVQTVQRLRSTFAAAESMTNPIAWWERQQQSLAQELTRQKSSVEQRLASGTATNAKKALNKQLETLSSNLDMLRGLRPSSLIADETLGEQSTVSFVEVLEKKLPKKLPGREQLLREFSAWHMLRVMPEGQRALLKGVSNSTGTPSGRELTTWRNFLSEYASEHYLHQDQKNHQTNHAPFEEGTVKTLRYVWGLGGSFEKNIINQSARQLQSLELSGNKADKKVKVNLVPVRGLLKIYAGEVGDACYAKLNREMAKGQYPEITAFILVTGRGTENERVRGSLLTIETKTSDGEPIIVIRANNPQENLLGQVESKVLVQKTFAEIKRLAARRGIKKVAVPTDHGATTNRFSIKQYYSRRLSKQSKTKLVNRPETNFNGYAIWDSGVVLID